MLDGAEYDPDLIRRVNEWDAKKEKPCNFVCESDGTKTPLDQTSYPKEPDKIDLSRFTDRARGVLRLATSHATRKRPVDKVHAFDILRGIVEDATGVGATVLKNIGAYEAAKQGTDDISPKGEYRKLPFSEDAKRTLQAARDAAESLGNNYVGTEHLLIGLATDIQFGHFMRGVVGAPHDKVLAEVKRLLGEWEKSKADPEPAFISQAKSLMEKSDGLEEAIKAYQREPNRILPKELFTAPQEPRDIARRRLAIVRIGEDEILDAIRLILGGVIGTAVYKAPWLDRLPKDAAIVRVGHDFATQQFELMLEHPSFDVVLDGAVPPILSDRFETIQTRFVTIKSVQDVDRREELEADNRRLRLELGKMVDERNAASVGKAIHDLASEWVVTPPKADEPITLSKEPSGSYVGATVAKKQLILNKDGDRFHVGDLVEYFWIGSDGTRSPEWKSATVSKNDMELPILLDSGGRVVAVDLQRPQFVIRKVSP